MPRQFLFEISWGQYLLLQQGYWQKQNRIWENEWLQTRELFWLGYNSNTTKEHQKTRRELIPLPSDPKPKKKMTVEKQHELFFMALSAFE